ncbi:MAG TPA: hypothetical protein VLN49_03580 [Gemmatimonadaceae bacterium]|nr:hypothetical protein [Gemmatimonadaceae bacterium]
MVAQLPGSGEHTHVLPLSRAKTIGLAVFALAAGALLLAFGLIILAGLALAGTVVGGGTMLYHRITGRWPRFLHVSTHVWTIGDQGASRAVPGLDPSKEVFPASPEQRSLPDSRDPKPRE